jgi:hypothetical protein
VPSKSTGFCVAKTVNHAGSGRRVPSLVTWRSSMHSSSAAWVRGGMRLISSTSSRSVKTGAGVEAEVLRTRAQNGGAQNVGRHQVGRGLHALEAEAEQPAQSLDDQRLGDARHAFQQRVALAENGDQHLFDHPLLAGDHAAQLRAGVGDELAGGAKPPCGCAFAVCALGS